MTRIECDEIAAWEVANLVNGRYHGESLSEFGFIYRLGDFVPVNARWSAMASHRAALRSSELFNKQTFPN